MEDVGEFHDWEMLQKSDTGHVQKPDSSQNSRDFEGIEGDSEGAIRSDYFTLENRYAKETAEEDREESSVESDNPSWVDPGSEPQYAALSNSEVDFGPIMLPPRNSGEFWSDSGSDRSIVQKLGDFDGEGKLGYGDCWKRGVGFEGTDAARKNLSEYWLDSQKFGDFLGKGEMRHEGIRIQPKDSSEFWLDSSENSKAVDGESELGSGDFLNAGLGSGSVGAVENDEGDDAVSGEIAEGDRSGFSVETDNFSATDVKSAKAEKKNVVWWKLPLELLKFCAFRVSPVWSFSIAAAVVGLVILGRRLYRMKRKSRSIPLKVIVDDKKVSQFMMRAARLNEAFSVVKRVPIVRPSLPAAGGVTPWPVMSLR